MAVIPELKEILNKSELTFEEVRAFETGLTMLTKEEQKTFAEIISHDLDLIYPLYINFKAKLRAARGTKKEWEKAIETEVTQLEEYLAKKRVGEEIK